MTESKTVEELWGPGTQRDKLIDFYRVIKNKGTEESPRWFPKEDTPAFAMDKVCKLAKELIDDYDTNPQQLKTMLQSAKWTPENIETVLCQNQ